MFYRLKNENELLDWADYKYNDTCLKTDLITQAEYNEHPNKIIVVDGEIVLNPDYDQEEADAREAAFKADFFLIPNFGWFRKQPKGYSSAVESLNTAFNAVTIMQKLPAGMLIFYQEPDFTKPEECTEEWLIEHQTYSEEMTAQEFGAFYVGFMTAWNNQEHVNEEENADTTNE
jgi:hypothetical protein